MIAVSALMKLSFEIQKMTSNDLLGSFLTTRGSSNLFEIIKNNKHGRMIPTFAFLQIFSDIREMTLNDLRGRKKIFDLGFREVNKHLIKVAPGMLLISNPKYVKNIGKKKCRLHFFH